MTEPTKDTALIFTAEQIKTLLEAAESLGDKCVWLAKDQGAYFCTDSVKKCETHGDERLVVYAEGCDPVAEPDDWWDRVRNICGGDDFGEELSVESLRRLASAGTGLVVTFTATEIRYDAGAK